MPIFHVPGRCKSRTTIGEQEHQCERDQGHTGDHEKVLTGANRRRITWSNRKRHSKR